MAKKSLILAALAGSALPALAQVTPINPEADVAGFRVVNRAGAYSGRAPQFVYDNVTNWFNPGILWSSLGGTQNQHQLVHINFCPGPACGQPQITIDQLTYGVRTPANLSDFDLVMRFWNSADVNRTVNPMITTGATPITEIRWQERGFGQAGGPFAWQVTPALPGPVALPPGTQDVYVEIMVTAPDGTLPVASDEFRLPILSNSGQQGATGNPAIAGSPDIPFGFDYNRDGVFAGSATVSNVAPSEHRGYAFVSSPANTNASYALRLRADVSVPPPTPVTDLGCVADAGLGTSSSVGASSVVWYQICLNGDAFDFVNQFFNADTEGSAGDVSIGFYDNGGALLATNNDAGTGTNDQVTFGVRSLPNAGADAQDYDGRDGEIVAGTYYLAVAPQGSAFGGGFTVTPSANAGGAFNLNLSTNTNGGPLPTTTPPTINGVDYDTLGGPIDPNVNGDARPGTGAVVPPGGVVWHKFTLANPTDATHYLDIDFFGLSGVSTDGMAFLFDSNGDLVAFADDEGEGLQPQLSSGMAGARTYGANTIPFDGATPVGMPALAAGTYYLGTGLWPLDYLDTLTVPNRWHLRGTSGSSLQLGADLYAGNDGGGPTCDPDVNQDGNVDQDDVSYLINVVGGGDNPTGIDPDFNQDGNVDQDDIAALINTVGGGGCP